MKMNMRISALFGSVAAALFALPVAAQASDGDFKPCGDAAVGKALEGSLCATVQAPLNPALPDADHVDLFVRKFPAQGVSRGDVWLVAGGPGEAGASFYPLVDRLRIAFPGYDLIIPDHRGTGLSSRLCVEEEAENSPGGYQLEGAEWATCFGLLNSRAPRTQAFTITNAAHDLNGLMSRFSAGRKTVLYGVSYGTQLVLRSRVVADAAPVDSIILDSLIPPETDEVWDLSRRSQVVDEVGRQVLADCDRDADCRQRLGGSAVDALKALEQDPEIAAQFPGGRPKLVFGALLNSQDARALIPDVIAGVRVGDWSKLEEARGRLERFGAPFEAAQAASSIPLVALISASENTARPDLTRDMVTAEEGELLFTSSIPTQLLGGASLAYPRDAAFGATPRSMPPVLVLQGDMDPKTPYAGALAHAGRLSGAGVVRFVRIEGAPHFVLLTAEACAVGEILAFSSSTGPGERTCTQ
jgi:pimeloyl-ACP methyl ester carboxylesterase